MQVVKSELEIFNSARYQSQIDRWMMREYSPISTLAHGTPLEFLITPVEGQMPDFSRSYLYLKVKIVTAADADNDATIEVAPVNMPLHSLWRSVDVYLGDTLISDANTLYPYRSIMSTLLTPYSNEALESYKQSAGFFKDTAGKMDINLCIGDPATNLGLKKRFDLFKASREVELADRLNVDLFNSDLLLPTNLAVRIRLVRSEDKFVLISKAGTVATKLLIREARFFVPFKVLSNDQYIALETTFKKANARIPIRRTTLKHVTLTAGQSTAALDNLILGKLPKRIVLAMVSEKDMTGDAQTNPFNFQHFNLNYLALNVNGDLVPAKPFQPNFDNGICVHEYLSMFAGMDIIYSRHGLLISRLDYPAGYTFFVFDLSADQSPGNDCLGPLRTGNVRLDARFSAPLASTVNLIVLAEYPSAILIDQYRNALPE